mmetsp:Transcript_42700/g.110017  ORF Transcript_42700/g.110017 Transcript_42700/m.110017 type:complete len:81 (-) Transcript_42700:85-327(-)
MLRMDSIRVDVLANFERAELLRTFLCCLTERSLSIGRGSTSRDNGLPTESSFLVGKKGRRGRDGPRSAMTARERLRPPKA